MLLRPRSRDNLDGRNRLRACELAGVDAIFEEFTGKDPLAFVVSENLDRRHLSESQRGMAAARLSNMKHRGDRKGEDFKGSIEPLIPGERPTQEKYLHEAAADLNVGRATAVRAKKIQKHGAPELVAAVDRGDVTIYAAHRVATLPHEGQRALVEEGPEAGRQETY